MKLSVIVPVHNEEANIQPFYRRIAPVLSRLAGVEAWEILFVNNGSADGTLEELLKLRVSDPHVNVVTLSRNFGYQGALTAGLSAAEADRYAMIDVDCEDPPELLERFHEEIGRGTQLAYGIRSNREEPPLITLGRRIFYWLNRRIADSEVIMWMAEFSMMTRQVRDAILSPRTTYPFLRAEMGYVGFRRVGVPYLRAQRAAGASHYNFQRMARFAIGGILSSTTFPLRVVLYLAVISAAAFPAAVALLRLSFEDAARLASIISLYFLLGTVPFLALYLARTYKNGVARPLFVVDQTQTFLGDEPAREALAFNEEGDPPCLSPSA